MADGDRLEFSGWQRLVFDGFGQFLLLIVILMLGGCDAEHEEHDDHEHFPPHWPETFLVAADRLGQIAENPNGTESRANSIEEEFADLIDWLPELLADSDVSQDDFDRIDAWAFPLASELKSSVMVGGTIDVLVQHELFRQGLPVLRDLATKTRTKMAEDRAREELEAHEAKRQAEIDSQPSGPGSGSN